MLCRVKQMTKPRITCLNNTERTLRVASCISPSRATAKESTCNGVKKEIDKNKRKKILQESSKVQTIIMKT